jgi:hypothetical protein
MPLKVASKSALTSQKPSIRLLQEQLLRKPRISQTPSLYINGIYYSDLLFQKLPLIGLLSMIQ